MGGIRAVGIVPGYVVMVPGFASFARGEGEEGGSERIVPSCRYGDIRNAFEEKIL